MIDTFNVKSIIQVGAGGTGSWLVPLVAKLTNNINLRLTDGSEKINYIIMEDDIVEPRNIQRQNFMEWDLSKNKAQALINRYCLECEYIGAETIKFDKQNIHKSKNYTLKFKTYLKKLKQPILNVERYLLIVLGCVDNNLSRRYIYKYLKNLAGYYALTSDHTYGKQLSIIYIDSGNNLTNGQVVTSWFGLDNFEVLQNKEQKTIDFLKMFPEETNTRTESCAFFGDQSQAINNFAAAIMFNCLQSILVNNKLPANLIEFNSNSFSRFEI